VPVTLVLLAVVVLASRQAGSGAEPVAPAGSAATSAAALPSITVAAPPPLTAAQQRACQELISALPTDLGDLPARPVDSPSPYVAAVGRAGRDACACGVPRRRRSSRPRTCQQINGVSWFAERRGSDPRPWIVVDRPVYVEVLARPRRPAPRWRGCPPR
jgi:hypothetical protein